MSKKFHSNCIIWSRKKFLCIQTQTCNSKVILFQFLLPGSTTNYQDIKSLQSRIWLVRRLFEEDMIIRYINIADEQSWSFTIMLPYMSSSRPINLSVSSNKVTGVYISHLTHSYHLNFLLLLLLHFSTPFNTAQNSNR